ncbi:hypothetical protein WMY93_032907 [Mugilogobius chulae]|uniref:Mediator of RNA polymerase II transcription subunit 8 n=1 Tax=Mugilogobius chulae TaxID=88201 RepID=A0AAW0MJJ6_9GOBI
MRQEFSDFVWSLHQREEKQLEASVESLISRVAHVKNALHSFIYKLENEYDRLTWPSVLDNFALLSGQLNTINKLLKNEKTPSYRSQVIIPLLLSPDRDDDLAKLTEQRVPVFSHEIVPDYLRTKPDPEVEEQEKLLSAEAARIGPEVAQKQIQTLNKLCSGLLEKLNNPRDEREAESAALRQNKPWFNPADTNALVGAVAFGKGLSKCRPPGPPGPPGLQAQGPMMSSGPTLQQVTIGGGNAIQQEEVWPASSRGARCVITLSHNSRGRQVREYTLTQQQGAPGKMPSSIKTNIKSASGSMHPYNR